MSSMNKKQPIIEHTFDPTLPFPLVVPGFQEGQDLGLHSHIQGL